MFQPAVCAVPWGGGGACQELSFLLLQSTNPLDQQSQAITGCPLCMLRSLPAASVRQLESAEGRAELLASAMQRECLVCVCALALGWEWESALCAPACQPHPREQGNVATLCVGTLQPWHVRTLTVCVCPTTPSAGAGVCCNHPGPASSACATASCPHPLASAL